MNRVVAFLLGFLTRMSFFKNNKRKIGEWGSIFGGIALIIGALTQVDPNTGAPLEGQAMTELVVAGGTMVVGGITSIYKRIKKTKKDSDQSETEEEVSDE